MTPHFHSLVPDGVFVPEEGGVRFEALPPPTQGEVEHDNQTGRCVSTPQAVSNAGNVAGGPWNDVVSSVGVSFR